jgi:alpha-ketoglutarate-dependent taurine dioxygenase
MVGLFINVLPMRVQISPDEPLLSFLKRVQERQFQVRSFEYAPLVNVQRWSEIPRGQPLFHSILSFENYPIDDSIQEYSRSLSISNVRNISRTNYPITIIVSPRNELFIRVVYDSRQFEDPTIGRLLDDLSTILSMMAAQPGADVSVLTEALNEKQKDRRSLERRRRDESNLNRFKRTRAKVVALPQGELVKTGYTREGSRLPLVIEPAVEGLDLIEWATASRSLIHDFLLKHGAVLFRHFHPTSVESFEQLAATLCNSLYAEYGDLPRENQGGKIYSSTPYPADKAILFHNESSHMQQWPQYIWFYCVKAAEQGGETPLVDCRRLYEEVGERMRRKLEEKKVMYVRNYVEGLDVSWEKFFGSEEREEVEEYCREGGIEYEWVGERGLRTRQVREAVRRHPKTGEKVMFNQLQLHHEAMLEEEVREAMKGILRGEMAREARYGDGSEISEEEMKELGEAYERLAEGFRWEEGDILMVDNMLVAHGRRPHVGRRKVVVAMGDMLRSADVESPRDLPVSV